MSAPELGTSSGPGSPAALVDGVDVDAVATAVHGCATVDDLYSSPSASVASYLPGRRVAGIRVDDSSVTIQVRGHWGVAAGDLAREVRQAVRPWVGSRRVDVVIADVTDAPGVSPVGPNDGQRSWTTYNAAPDANGSRNITPIMVEIPPHS
ncbi:MAG: hypothetical protein JWM76_5078 [Pseudonocardiales bacterium]|nr:hypothetical protein [Pseudonocardiales bacterium]